MAFLKLVCKANKINRIKLDLAKEKENSIQLSEGITPKYTLKQKYRHFWIDLKERIKKFCCSCFEKTCLHRTCYKLRSDGTCENFTLKSVAGFIGGFFLTYVFFMFFVFQLNFKLSTATIMCSVLGAILTIGLAFSYKVRCVVFLVLPQFFSKRGRQALLAYAFILAITGPAKNTLNNMGILTDSLACGEEQLKDAVRQIIDAIKKPFYAIKDAIKQVVKTVKAIMKKIKEILLTIKRIVMAIVRVIKAAFQFLAKIINVCNKELGTPFERCSRVFENAIADCNAKLGPMFNWLCSITYIVKSVCYIVKIFDYICMIVDFISNSIIGVVIRKIKTFVRHIRTMFYVRIRFSHSFQAETNRSKSISEVTEGIVTEIRHRSEAILAVFDLMTCATSMFFFFIILKAMHYRYKFLTSERFDNKYITKNFRFIDMRRAKLEKETVLPLNHREKKIYVSPKSFRLVKTEKRSLHKASAILCTATLKLCTHMMTDYALYWVLIKIRYYGRFQSTYQAPNIPGLHIEGKGLLADLLRSIVTAFQPVGIKLEIDTVRCLPNPIPPDYDRYIQIGSLLILCWLLTIFEPYGLRLRHTVMCYYHPVRAKQRSVWLYNHILRSRSSFLKFARRQLKRKIMGTKGIEKVTCKEWIRAHIKNKWLLMCLGSDKQMSCLLCSEVFRESDKVKPIKCQTPQCPGIYCEQCFEDLQNLCTVCLSPIDYGDLSDISEEKDSSGEEAVVEKKKKKKRGCRISKCCKKKKDKHSDTSDTEDDERTGLIPKPKKPATDSDYYSSGNSTEYSYTYQNQKDITAPSPRHPPSFRDVEKQHLPDHASMDSFRKGTTDDEGSELSSPEEHAYSPSSSSYLTPLDKDAVPLLVEDALRHKPRDSRLVKIVVSRKVPKQKVRRRIRVPSRDSSPVTADGRRVPRSYEIPRSPTAQEDKATETMQKTMFDDCSSVDSEIKHKHKNVVPKLDLSSIHSENSPQYIYNKPENRFKNVRYEIVKETPSSLSGSSTVRSRINSDGREILEMPVFDTGTDPLEAYDVDRTARSKGHKSNNKSRKYSKKVSDNPKIAKKPNKFVKFLRKVFRKKSKSSALLKLQLANNNEQQVTLVSPKSPATTSFSPSEEYSSYSPLDGPPSTSEDTPSSSLMGGSPTKHLRGGEEPKFDYQVLEDHHHKHLYYESSDTDITQVRNRFAKKKIEELNLQLDLHIAYPEQEEEKQRQIEEAKNRSALVSQGTETSITNVLDVKPTKEHPQAQEHQMIVGDNTSGDIEGTQRYSREPPERDESADTMRIRNYTPSNQIYDHRQPPAHLTPQYTDSNESSTISSNTAANILGFPVHHRHKIHTEVKNIDEYHRGSPIHSPVRYGSQESAQRQDRRDSDLSRKDRSSITDRDNRNDRSSLSDRDLNASRQERSSLGDRDSSRNNSGRYSTENTSGTAGRTIETDYLATDTSITSTTNGGRRTSRDSRGSPVSYSRSKGSSQSAPEVSKDNNRRHTGDNSYSSNTDSRRFCKRNAGKGDPEADRDVYRGTHHVEHYRGSQRPKPRMYDRGEYCEYCKCKYCRCGSNNYHEEEYTGDDQCSVYSNSSRDSKVIDLAYQNNEEYVDLVQELEDTLSQRNKERVRRTMRQFEIMSRQNKNLDKPIFDDDDVMVPPRPKSPQNPCRCHPQQHHSREKSPRRHHHRPERDHKRCSHQMSSGYVEDIVRNMDPNGEAVQEQAKKYPKFKRSQGISRWQLDKQSGEWYKVYDEYGQPMPHDRCLCGNRRKEEFCRGPRGYKCCKCGYYR